MSGCFIPSFLLLSKEAAEDGPPSVRTLTGKASPSCGYFKKGVFFLSDPTTIYILNRKGGGQKKRGPVKERRIYPCDEIVGNHVKSR